MKNKWEEGPPRNLYKEQNGRLEERKIGGETTMPLSRTNESLE
jgi:hypothetical protein